MGTSFKKLVLINAQLVPDECYNFMDDLPSVPFLWPSPFFPLLEIPRDIDSKRTVTEIRIAEGDREFALRRLLLEALEVRFQTDVPGPTEISKS